MATPSDSFRAQGLLRRSQEVAQVDPAQVAAQEIQAQAPMQEASMGRLDQTAKAMGGDAAMLGDAIRQKASRTYNRGIDEMITRNQLAAPEQRQNLRSGAIEQTFKARDVNSQIVQQQRDIEAEKERQRNQVFGSILGGALGLVGNFIPLPKG
jgi:hypothetical protein